MGAFFIKNQLKGIKIMEICSRFTGMERKDGAFLLHTDNADIMYGDFLC